MRCTPKAFVQSCRSVVVGRGRILAQRCIASNVEGGKTKGRDENKREARIIMIPRRCDRRFLLRNEQMRYFFMSGTLQRGRFHASGPYIQFY